MIKKFFSLLLALTALLGLLTACGAAAVDQGGNGSQAGEAGVQDRDSVIIAISSEPETLDPCQGWGHGNTPIVQSTLVKYDYDMSFSKRPGHRLQPVRGRPDLDLHPPGRRLLHRRRGGDRLRRGLHL